MNATRHDSPPLGMFEQRLLDELTDLDSRRAAVPVTRGADRRRRHVRRPLVVAGVAAGAVLVGSATAVATFITQPRTLQAGSETVFAGEETVLKGSGCAAGSELTVRLDGAVLGSTTATGEGLFIATATIPAATASGPHTITTSCLGDDGQNLVQELTLTVSAAEDREPLGPTLDVGGAAPLGGVAFVKGAGCQPGSEVRLSLDRVLAPAATANAGPEGQFTATVPIPARAKLGNHEVTAICAQSNGTDLTQKALLVVVVPEPDPTISKPAG